MAHLKQHMQDDSTALNIIPCVFEEKTKHNESSSMVLHTYIDPGTDQMYSYFRGRKLIANVINLKDNLEVSHIKQIKQGKRNEIEVLESWSQYRNWSLEHAQNKENCIPIEKLLDILEIVHND